MIIFKWIKNKEIQSQNNNTILCFMVSLKGKFSQNDNSVIITHPHVVPNLYGFLSDMKLRKYFSINVNWDSTSSKNVEKNNIKVPE